MTTDNLTSSNVDEAIAKAKARVRENARKVELGDSDMSMDVGRKEQEMLSNAERAERHMERERIREQKKFERDAAAAKRKEERDAKRLARELKRQQEFMNRPPAHMSKVEKAAERLPPLSDDLTASYSSLVGQFSVGELSLLIAHLQVSNRAQQTLASNGVNFSEGQQVRIIASENDASLIGKVGTVTEMRKIRVLLDVEGVKKPVYLFAADCEELNEQRIEREENPVTEEDVVGTNVSDDGFLSFSEEEELTGTEN